MKSYEVIFGVLTLAFALDAVHIRVTDRRGLSTSCRAGASVTASVLVLGAVWAVLRCGW